MARRAVVLDVAGQNAIKVKRTVLYLAPKGVAEDDLYRGSTGGSKGESVAQKWGWPVERSPVVDPNRGGSGSGRDDEIFTCASAKDGVKNVSVRYVQRLQSPRLWVAKRRWAMVGS